MVGFSADIPSIIAFLVDRELDRSFESIERLESKWGSGRNRRPGMLFSFPVEVSAWTGIDGNDPEGYIASIRKQVVMVFAGNTSVWWKVVDGPIFSEKDIDLEGFENSSNHDSCWRSDGFSFLTQMYFDMCEKVNKETKTDMAPRDMDSVSSFILWTKIKKCKITYSWVSGEYRNQLEAVEFEKDGV